MYFFAIEKLVFMVLMSHGFCAGWSFVAQLVVVTFGPAKSCVHYNKVLYLDVMSPDYNSNSNNSNNSSSSYEENYEDNYFSLTNRRTINRRKDKKYIIIWEKRKVNLLLMLTF